MVAPTLKTGEMMCKYTTQPLGVGRFCGGNFAVLQRATTGRPYRGKWDNEIQFVDFLFERIFVYQIWLHPTQNHTTQPVGATIGRPPLVLPQKDMGTL